MSGAGGAGAAGSFLNTAPPIKPPTVEKIAAISNVIRKPNSSPDGPLMPSMNRIAWSTDSGGTFICSNISTIFSRSSGDGPPPATLTRPWTIVEATE